MLLENGFPTRLSFSSMPFPNFFIREREVQPPEVDGGGEIDTTTMRNITYRTRSEKSLKHLNTMTVRAQYDPFIYSQALVMINLRQIIIITFPDNARLEFPGFLDKITPPSHQEGEFPLCELKIVPTMRNTNGDSFQWTIIPGDNVGKVIK